MLRRMRRIALDVAIVLTGLEFLSLCPQAAAQGAPGGAYIGYYQEDPVTNPEDPVPGALYLRVPAADGAFSGDMFFTYIGCQSSNLGRISGRKSGTSLSGNWSGTVDDLAQRGSFAGSYSAAAGYFTGTYTIAGGKQHRDLSPCIEYYIAPNGSWALFPVERNTPAAFDIQVTPDGARWTRQRDAGESHVTIFDAATLAAPQGNAIVWQTIIESRSNRVDLDDVPLVSGRAYILAVTVIDETARRLAFGSRRFVAP
jgi:hypothetical protein